MGFSAHRPELRSIRFRSPIRLHSELSIGRALRAALQKIGQLAVSATNDARIVGGVLLVAAAALAVEMAASFK